MTHFVSYKFRDCWQALIKTVTKMLLLTHHKTLFAYVETNTYLYCLVMYAKKKIHKINNHVDANIIDKQIS